MSLTHHRSSNAHIMLRMSVAASSRLVHRRYGASPTDQALQHSFRINVLAAAVRRLNDDRRAWLQRLREETRRTLDWTAGQWAAHDAALKAEFDQQYSEVTKDKCSNLAGATDNERKALAR